MRPGFRYDAYKGCQHYHQCRIFANPGARIKEIQENTYSYKDSESPCEYAWQMSHYHMMPYVLINEMVSGQNQHYKHYEAESSKENIHPFLAQQVDAALKMMMLMFVAMVQETGH